MMASKKSSVPQRPRSKGVKKGAMKQYMIAGGVALALVIVVVVVLSGGSKPKPPPKTRAQKSETSAKKSVAKDRSVKVSGRSVRDERRTARELERKKRAEARAEGKGRRGRQTSGGGVSRSSSRSSSASNQLKMIVTDPSTNQRYALVGERRFKVGDDVEGRRILEVGPDAVKVEYRQSTYSVRVGQTVY